MADAAPLLDSEAPAQHSTAEQAAAGPQPRPSDSDPPKARIHSDEPAAQRDAQQQGSAPDDTGASSEQHTADADANGGPQPHPSDADANGGARPHPSDADDGARPHPSSAGPNGEQPQPVPAGSSATPNSPARTGTAQPQLADGRPAGTRPRSDTPTGSPQRGQDRRGGAAAGTPRQDRRRTVVTAQTDTKPPELEVTPANAQEAAPVLVSVTAPDEAASVAHPADSASSKPGSAGQPHPGESHTPTAAESHHSTTTSDAPAGGEVSARDRNASTDGNGTDRTESTPEHTRAPEPQPDQQTIDAPAPKQPPAVPDAATDHATATATDVRHPADNEPANARNHADDPTAQPTAHHDPTPDNASTSGRPHPADTEATTGPRPHPADSPSNKTDPSTAEQAADPVSHDADSSAVDRPDVGERAVRLAGELRTELAELPSGDPAVKHDLTEQQGEQFTAASKKMLALYRSRTEELAGESWAQRRQVMEDGDEVESLLRYIHAVREGTGKTPRWNQIKAFLVAEHGYMRQMGTAQGKTIVGSEDSLWQLSRGEPVQLADGRWVRVHHVITTTEVLANEGFRQFGTMMRSLGYEVSRWDPHNPPADPQRPTVYYMTYDELATANLFDRLPPGDTATIDEADAVLVHDQTVHYQSDGQRAPASDVEAAGVYRVRDFLRGVLAHRELTSADLRARPEESLARVSRLWESYAGRKFTAEETEMARTFLDVKAGRLKLNRDFQKFDDKIQILDENGKPRSDPKVGTDSRWFGGRHKMVEAMFDAQVYSDGTGSKQVTVEDVLGRYRRLNLMSGTLERTATEIKENFPVQGGLAKIENFGKSNLVGEQDQIFLTGPEMFKDAVEQVRQLQDKGRPVLVIASNDVAWKFSLMLKKADIEHTAITGKWFAEHRDNNAAEEHLSGVMDTAGKKGNVTVGTPGMLGRGFDAVVDAEVNQLGGLHAHMLGRSTNADTDAQCAARAGRNGSNGSYRFNDTITGNLYSETHNPRAKIAITHYRDAAAEHTQAVNDHNKATREADTLDPTQPANPDAAAAKAKVDATAADVATAQQKLTAAEQELRSLTPTLQNEAAERARLGRAIRRANQAAQSSDHTPGPPAHAPPTTQSDDPNRRHFINQMPQELSGGTLNAATAGQESLLDDKISKSGRPLLADTTEVLQQAQSGDPAAAHILQRRFGAATYQHVLTVLGWDPAHGTPPEPVQQLAHAINAAGYHAAQLNGWQIPAGRQLGDWLAEHMRNALVDSTLHMTNPEIATITGIHNALRNGHDLSPRQLAAIRTMTEAARAQVASDAPDTRQSTALTTNNTTSETRSGSPAASARQDRGQTDSEPTPAPTPPAGTHAAAPAKPVVATRSASHSRASDLFQDESWVANPPGSRRDPAMVTAVDPANPIGPSARVPYRPAAAGNDPEVTGHSETPASPARPTVSDEPAALGPESTPRDPGENTAAESPQVSNVAHADSTDAPQQPLPSDALDEPTDDLIALLPLAQQGNHRATQTLRRRLRRGTTQRVSALLGWDPTHGTPPGPVRRLASAISLTALRSAERGRWAVPQGMDISDWVFAAARNTLLDNLAQLTSAQRQLVTNATDSARHRIDLTDRQAAEIDRLTRQVHQRARAEEPASSDPVSHSERRGDLDLDRTSAPGDPVDSVPENPRQADGIDGDAPASADHTTAPPPAAPTTANDVADRGPSELSSREREVLRLMAQGLSAAEVGATLTLSPTTVHSYLARAGEKFHTSGVIPTILAAARAGELGDNTEQFEPVELSEAETTVVQMVADGRTNRDIATVVGADRVTPLLAQLYETLDVDTRVGLALAAQRRGLLDGSGPAPTEAPGSTPAAAPHTEATSTRAVAPAVADIGAASSPGPEVLHELRAELRNARARTRAETAELSDLLDVDPYLVRPGSVLLALYVVQQQIRGGSVEPQAVAAVAEPITRWIRSWIELHDDIETATNEGAKVARADPDVQRDLIKRNEQLATRLSRLLGLPRRSPIGHTPEDDPLAVLREVVSVTGSSEIGRLIDAVAAFLDNYGSDESAPALDVVQVRAIRRRLAEAIGCAPHEVGREELLALGLSAAEVDREPSRSDIAELATVSESFVDEVLNSAEPRYSESAQRVLVAAQWLGCLDTYEDVIDPEYVEQRFVPPHLVDGRFVPAWFEDQPQMIDVAESVGMNLSTTSRALRGIGSPGGVRRARAAAASAKYWYHPAGPSGPSTDGPAQPGSPQSHDESEPTPPAAQVEIDREESGTPDTPPTPSPTGNGSNLSKAASAVTSGSATASWIPPAYSLPESPVPHPDAEAEKYLKQAIAADLFLTYGIEIVGLDKSTISIDTALSIRNAIVDELTEDDSVRIDAIVVLPIENETYAATGPWGGPEHLILLNETYFGNPESFRAGFKRNVEAGLLNAPTGDPAYDLIRHEIAHLRDPYHYLSREAKPRYPELTEQRIAGTLPSDARFDRRRDYSGWLEAKAFGFLYTHFAGLKQAGALPKETRFDEWLDLLDGYSRELKELFPGEGHEQSRKPGVAEPTLGDRPVFNPKEALAEANNAFGNSAPADFTHPAYALQALLRGIPVAQVWRDAQRRNVVAAARAQDRGPIPEAFGFRASMRPDGVLVRLTRRWRDLSPDEQQQMKTTDPILMCVGRDGRQTFGLDELARSVDRQRAEMWGANTHSHESDTGDPLPGFSEWEHAPTGELGQWLHDMSETAWQRADLLREVRQLLVGTDGLAEFLGLGAWADAGAAQAYLDVVDLRARAEAALSHPDTDDRIRSRLRALLSHIDAIMRRCAGFDAELAYARTRAERQVMRHVAAARGGLSLGPYGRIVDEVGVEVFEGRGQPSEATNILRDMLEQLGIPVITRRVRVDSTGRVLVEKPPEPVRASTAGRQDRLWQLCSPNTDTQPLWAADEPDEPSARPRQHNASTAELPQAQPVWGARIADAQRKLARTAKVRRRLFPDPVDPDRMTPADAARQRMLLARLEMLTEYLRTVRIQAAAAAAQQCLDQLPGQRIGRWARLDGNLLTIAAPFADPDHLLPLRTREALAQAGIRVEYRRVQVDDRGRAWSTSFSPTRLEPQPVTPAGQAAHSLIDNIVSHLDRLLERHGVTKSSGDRIPLPQLLDDRTNLVAERERARAARDRWRAARDRWPTARDDDTASAQQQMAAAHAAQFEREFHRLDAEIARLTLLAFGAAEADPQLRAHRESSRRMLRSDAKTQSLVSAARTPELLQEIRDPLVAHLLTVAQRLRATLDQPGPTEPFDTTVALTEMLEDINNHQTGVSSDAPDADRPTGTAQAGANIHSELAPAAAKPRQLRKPPARQENPAEERSADLPDTASAATPGNRPLSKRQQAIHTLITEGKTNAEIADSLGMPVETVKTHVRRIRDKLGVSRRSELAPQPASSAAAEESPHKLAAHVRTISSMHRADTGPELSGIESAILRGIAESKTYTDQPTSTPWQKSPTQPDRAGTDHALDRVGGRPSEFSEAPRGNQDDLGVLNAYGKDMKGHAHRLPGGRRRGSAQRAQEDPDNPWSALKRNAGKRFRHAGDTPAADTSAETNPNTEVDPEIPDRAQALLDRLGCGPAQVEQLAVGGIAELRKYLGPDAALLSLTMPVDPQDVVQASAARANAVARWWNALTDIQQAALILRHPHQIGNADGVPYTVRDEANRRSIIDDIKGFLERKPDADNEGLLTEARALLRLGRPGHVLSPEETVHLTNLVRTLQHLAALEQDVREFDSPPVQLIAYDATAYDGDGRIIVSIDDADKAAIVTRQLGGVGNTLQKLPKRAQAVLAQYAESARHNPGVPTATIIDIGFHHPNTVEEIRSSELAEQGGDIVAAEIAAYDATRATWAGLPGGAAPPRLRTVVAHSYGSTTLCYAGMGRRLAAHIDQVVLTGSPGAGPMAHADEFGIGADNVFAVADDRDPVTHAGGSAPQATDRYLGLSRGRNPVGRWGAVRLAAAMPSTVRSVKRIHGGYLIYLDSELRVPTISLRNIALVCAGKADLAERAQHRPPSDAAGRLRDLFWWRANATALAAAMGADAPESEDEPNILPDNGTRRATGPVTHATTASPWQRSDADAGRGLEPAPHRRGAVPDVVEALDLPKGKRPDPTGLDLDRIPALPGQHSMGMVFARDPNLDGDAHATGPSDGQPNPPAEEPVSLRELLSTNKPYRQLYISNALTGIGDNVQRSALPLLMLELTGSPMAAGLASFAVFIPQVLFELPAGYVADFHDRWRTMLIAQSVGLMSTAGAGALVLSGARGHLGTALAAATMVEGTATIFYLRSLRSVVLDLVTPAQRPRANRLSEIEASIAATGGRALGPILLDAVKTLPFAANGASYAWNLGTLSRLRDAFPRRTSAPTHGFRDSVRHIGEGVRAVWQEPFLREYSGLTLLTNASFAALNLRTAAVLNDAALPGVAAGAVLAATGVGGVVGGLLPVRFIEKVRADVVYPVSLAGFTGVAALQAVSTNPIALAAGAFGISALGVSMNARIASYEQNVLPRSVYGRATSAKSLVLGAGPAIGGLLGGALLSSQGITPAGWIPVAVIGAAAAGAAARRVVNRGGGLLGLLWHRKAVSTENAATPVPDPVTDAQRALPDHADSFTQIQAGSDRDFAAAAHAYLSDLMTVARYHLTQTGDRTTGLDLLSRITEVLSVVDTRLTLGQAPGTAHREIRRLHGELTSLLADTTQDRGDEITNLASSRLAPSMPGTNALERTLTRLRRVGHPLEDCVNQTSRAAWALGVDAGIQPAPGENDWEALEAAITAQLVPVHPPTGATVADMLASSIEEVRNRDNGTDSIAFLVDDGTEMHSWLVTGVDDDVIVFDTNVGDPDPDADPEAEEPSTPRIRMLDKWEQPYPHIEEAFVARLKSAGNKLSARDEPLPDAARSFPRRGPITGPPAASDAAAAADKVPLTRTAGTQQESARGATAHTEPEPPDNPKTFTAEELETIADLKRQLLEIDPDAFWYIRDLPMPEPEDLYGDEWVSNRGKWFDALFSGDIKTLRKVELTEKDFLELGRILERFPAYVTLTLLVATGLKAEQLLHLPRTSPGSLFFKQVKRVQGDKTTIVYKFRTMPEEEPEQPSNRDTAERISRGQQFARDTSFDELPQLLAIARGRMQYFSGRPMLDGDRERMRGVLTPEEYKIWNAHLKDDLWSALHFPGCRALDPDSDEYLRSRYLAARLWSMIGSRRAEEYMMKVVDGYLLGILPGKLRELVWGTGTDALAGIAHVLGRIGNWTRRVALSVFPDPDTQTAVGGPPPDPTDVPARGAMPPGADTIAAALGISPRRAHEIWVDQANASVHGGPNPMVLTQFGP
ncbi:MFS transporter [Nocardia sp. NPDC050408]|uniref:MFS transporter n=1 Tax=Nocardia sp. NPDC050408 TaxID=3364319 RepID=UPI003790AF57